MMMNRNSTNQTISTSKQIIAAILAFIPVSYTHLTLPTT